MQSLRFTRTVFTVFTLVFALATFAFSSGSMAQSGPPLGPTGMLAMEPVALTTGMVENVLKSLPAMRAFSKKHNLEESMKSMQGDPSADFLKYLDTKNLKAPMESMLRPYGFKGIKQWTGAMQSLVMAYGFVKNGKSLAEVKSEMQAMITRLESDPNLPQSQKDSLVGMFKKQINMVINLTPQGNIDAVSGLMPQIDAAMKAKQ